MTGKGVDMALGMRMVLLRAATMRGASVLAGLEKKEGPQHVDVALCDPLGDLQLRDETSEFVTEMIKRAVALQRMTFTLLMMMTYSTLDESRSKNARPPALGTEPRAALDRVRGSMGVCEGWVGTKVQPGSLVVTDSQPQVQQLTSALDLGTTGLWRVPNVVEVILDDEWGAHAVTDICRTCEKLGIDSVTFLPFVRKLGGVDEASRYAQAYDIAVRHLRNAGLRVQGGEESPEIMAPHGDSVVTRRIADMAGRIRSSA